MRLIFMGTPDFAVPAFEALRTAGHEVIHVYTQPPRPAGRGRSLRPSPVQSAADAARIPVRSPANIKNNEQELAFFEALSADIAIVVAYGLILPERMLHAPRQGCLNVHASLLPRWRGASPIQSAILAGDDRTGISIMQMDAGLDTGSVLATKAIALTQNETASTLHDRLALLGSELLVETLTRPLLAVPQHSEGITYAERLTRESGRIDWAHSASTIERQIRGLTPWPGAFTTQEKTVLKIGEARIVSLTHTGSPPGTTLDDTLTVACGENAIQIVKLQRPGRAMMATTEFLRGTPIPKGTFFGK